MLLLLANFGKEGSPRPISPNISLETLAEMIITIAPAKLLHEHFVDWASSITMGILRSTIRCSARCCMTSPS
jgi:hypothetical protein